MSHGRLWKLGIFAEQKYYYQSNGSAHVTDEPKIACATFRIFTYPIAGAPCDISKTQTLVIYLSWNFCNHLKSESHLELLNHEKFVLRITMIKQKMRRQLVCKVWVCTRKPLSIFRKNWKCHNIKTDASFVEQLYMVPWTRLIIVYMAIAIEQQ